MLTEQAQQVRPAVRAAAAAAPNRRLSPQLTRGPPAALPHPCARATAPAAAQACSAAPNGAVGAAATVHRPVSAFAPQRLRGKGDDTGSQMAANAGAHSLQFAGLQVPTAVASVASATALPCCQPGTHQEVTGTVGVRVCPFVAPAAGYRQHSKHTHTHTHTRGCQVLAPKTHMNVRCVR